MGVLVKLTF